MYSISFWSTFDESEHKYRRSGPHGGDGLCVICNNTLCQQHVPASMCLSVCRSVVGQPQHVVTGMDSRLPDPPLLSGSMVYALHYRFPLPLLLCRAYICAVVYSVRQAWTWLRRCWYVSLCFWAVETNMSVEESCNSWPDARGRWTCRQRGTSQPTTGDERMSLQSLKGNI